MGTRTVMPRIIRMTTRTLIRIPIHTAIPTTIIMPTLPGRVSFGRWR